MESCSQEIDPSLSWEQLDALVDKLTLPQGWSYSSRPVTADLVLGNGGTAYLAQDTFRVTAREMLFDQPESCPICRRAVLRRTCHRGE